MKANEYFRKHGYEHCKSACLQNGWLNTGFWISLKRYVDAYELVQSYGGLSQSRRWVERTVFKLSDSMIALKKAIALVEECQ